MIQKEPNATKVRLSRSEHILMHHFAHNLNVVVPQLENGIVASFQVVRNLSSVHRIYLSHLLKYQLANRQDRAAGLRLLC